jgi:protein-tyrosine phosphatase
MSNRILWLAAIAGALVSCATPVLRFEHAPVVRPIIERINDNLVRIQWPESFSSGSVAVFKVVGPDSIDRSKPIAVSSGRTLELTEADDARIGLRQRLYYEVVPSSEREPVVISERRLPLECCDNVRDLGGYETKDGRSVRWNRIYRANDLSKLTREDFEYLSQFDIRLVCDFRSERESDASPSRVIERNSPVRLSLPVDQTGLDPNDVRRRIRTGGMVAFGAEQRMKDAYRAFVTDYSEEWMAMFERLARPENLPTVIHCTAGKDRTGFASALVLLALGVPKETIFEDYLLTNYYQQNFFRFVLRWVPLYSFFRTDPKDLLPLLEARRAYLQTALDEMVERYGSIDGYLEQALGLETSLRSKLKIQFLE